MLIGIDASRAVTQQRTGTEAYAYFLIQALLQRTAVSPYKIRLYFNQAPPPDLFPAYPHVTQRVIPFPRLWTHLRLGWELQQNPPDWFFTPAHVIPLSYLGRSVATVHDLGYHHFPEAHPRGDLWYLHWSTRHNSRRASHILADSEATKQDLVTLDGVPANKISVVYPGLDTQLKPQAPSSDLLARYAIHQPYFLYLSTLQPRKNLARLITAYVQADVPHQLVLAGKVGWLADPILAQIQALPKETQNKIKLIGFVPDEDKPALLTGATALLYPSLYEGFGFPVLEAQQCQTAVLTANISSLPELANGSAYLVDPLNVHTMTQGIRALAVDEALRTRLVQLGEANVKRFKWETAVTQLLRIFT